MLTGGAYADRVESMLRQSGTGSYSLVASQVSLGEATAVIMRRGPRAARMLDGLHALLSDYRVEPGRCMPPLDAVILGVVRDLDHVAPDLDTTDRVILAHALADPHSIFFITRDKAILASSEIVLYEEEARAMGRRKARLAIIDLDGTCPAS